MAGNRIMKNFLGPNSIYKILFHLRSVKFKFSSHFMSRNNCIFCDIYQGKHDSNILHKDSEIVIFPDIRPVAKHHYLIVSKIHIRNAKELTKDQIPLLNKLIQHGKMILEEKGADMTDTRFGFHWPPFHSVSHLHLHAISPASSMSLISKLIFKPNTLWFVQPEYVLERLSSME